MSTPKPLVLLLCCLCFLAACGSSSPTIAEHPRATELQRALDSSREAGGVLGVSAAIIDADAVLSNSDKEQELAAVVDALLAVALEPSGPDSSGEATGR